MSVLMNLTSSQSKVFKGLMEAAKLEGLVYRDNSVELTADNFIPIQDVLEKAWLDALIGDYTDDTEFLRAIILRLTWLEGHFPSGEAFEKIKAGLEDAIEYVEDNKETRGWDWLQSEESDAPMELEETFTEENKDNA